MAGTYAGADEMPGIAPSVEPLGAANVSTIVGLDTSDFVVVSDVAIQQQTEHQSASVVASTRIGGVTPTVAAEQGMWGHDSAVESSGPPAASATSIQSRSPIGVDPVDTSVRPMGRAGLSEEPPSQWSGSGGGTTNARGMLASQGACASGHAEPWRAELAAFRDEAAAQSARALSANAALLQARTQITALEAKLEASDSHVRCLEAQVAAQAVEIQSLRQAAKDEPSSETGRSADSKVDLQQCEARLAQLERDLTRKEQQLASMHSSTLAGDAARVSSLALAAELQEKLAAKDRQIDKLQAHAESVTRELELRQEVLKTFEARLGQVEQAALRPSVARSPARPPSRPATPTPPGRPASAAAPSAERWLRAPEPSEAVEDAARGSLPATTPVQEAALEDARRRVQQLYSQLTVHNAAALGRPSESWVHGPSLGPPAAVDQRHANALATPSTPGTATKVSPTGAHALHEISHESSLLRVGQPCLVNCSTTSSPGIPHHQILMQASPRHEHQERGMPIQERGLQHCTVGDHTRTVTNLEQKIADLEALIGKTKRGGVVPVPGVQRVQPATSSVGMRASGVRSGTASPLQQSRSESCIVSPARSPVPDAVCRGLTLASPAITGSCTGLRNLLDARSCHTSPATSPAPPTPRFVSPPASDIKLVGLMTGVQVSTPLQPALSGPQGMLQRCSGTPPRGPGAPAAASGGCSLAARLGAMPGAVGAGPLAPAADPPMGGAGGSPRCSGVGAGTVALAGQRTPPADLRAIPTPMGAAAWAGQPRLQATLQPALAATPGAVVKAAAPLCAASHAAPIAELQAPAALVTRRWPQQHCR